MSYYPVKMYTSAMTGAPILNNNWGDLIAVLDACLVNGFNLKTLDSLTFDVNTGLATATVSTGHGYTVDQVVLISGADQAEYNGEHSVVSTTTTTFSFAVTGTPVTPATTSTQLTAKVAPLGWSAPYRADYKVAYRPTDPTATGNMLLVDNRLKTPNYTTTWAKWANVGIVEGMSDIDTIVGAQAPYDAAKPSKNWQQVEANQWGWFKWYHARQFTNTANIYYENTGDGGTTPRSWVLIGDGGLFYLFNEYAAGYSLAFYLFGDIVSYKAVDHYATALAAKEIYLGNSVNFGVHSSYGNVIRSDNAYGAVLLRSYTQLDNPVGFTLISLLYKGSLPSISGIDGMPYPNGPDYSLWLLPYFVRQADGHMRGIMPGLYYVPHTRPYAHLAVVDNVTGYPGRKFVMVRVGYDYSSDGQVAIDITGPWR